MAPAKQTKVTSERVLVLVKALPHPGKSHAETVCCAGVTIDGAWRRQYPIHFRQLKDRFQRWQWIEYEYVVPKDDKRPESRRVQEDTLQVSDDMPERERAPFLDRIIMPSTKAAAAKKMTLALIRPQSPRFHWAKKTAEQVLEERRANEAAARQLSIFDNEIATLEPCPYEFLFDYVSADGKHTGTCADWETAAMFWKWSKEFGEEETLKRMGKVFGEVYPAKGMVFAMGTHSLYPDTWLLVGVIRLDVLKQTSLAL
jgi:hypothetical protein